MKKILIYALTLFLFKAATAQNTFPGTGYVGIGTSSPTSLLNLNNQYAQLKLQGASSGWLGSDLILSRTSSGNQLWRSPNIQFLDEATNASSYIQSFQGNLQFFPGGVQTLSLLNGGKVGVGVTTPTSTFQVEAFSSKLNIASAGSLGGSSYIGFNAAKLSTNGNWRFDSNGSLDGGAVIYADMNGNINFAAVPNLNGSAFFEQTDADLKSRIYFQVSSAGLARAKKLKIETANWPDFVFSKSYQLLPLSSVAQYIKAHHRLPEMPAASEVQVEGLDVGEMNKLLVKKVEELTLYLIEKDEQLKAQSRQNQDLEKRLVRLEKLIKKP